MHSKFHFNTLSLWRQSTHSQVPQKNKKTSKTDKISKRLINSCHGHNETNEYSRNSGITINTHTKANQFNNNAAEPDPAPAVHSMRTL